MLIKKKQTWHQTGYMLLFLKSMRQREKRESYIHGISLEENLKTGNIYCPKRGKISGSQGEVGDDFLNMALEMSFEV